jgi:hypothetical protein
MVTQHETIQILEMLMLAYMIQTTQQPNPVDRAEDGCTMQAH